MSGGMTAGTLGLVMIVKDEERTLPRLAASIGGQIDHWTIVDTGSTDGTKELVAELFDDVPGELVEDDWRGFGPSRNVALAAAQPHTDWLVTLDADETVEGDLRAGLGGHVGDQVADAVEAAQRYDTLTFWTPRLLRAGAGWRWLGRTHEHLTLGDRPPRLIRTEAFSVVHHGDGGSRSDKFERDLRLLEADLVEMPDDPRTIFYLARTYEDLGQPGPAEALYGRRAALEGWDEERWYARWRRGCCLLALGHHDEGVGVLLRAWAERPWRAEPLCTLAEHHRRQGEWRLGWETGLLAARHTAAGPDGAGPEPARDRLFVHDDVYRWRLAFERSICAWYVGEHAVGGRLYDYLLEQELPTAVHESVVANRGFYSA